MLLDNSVEQLHVTLVRTGSCIRLLQPRKSSFTMSFVLRLAIFAVVGLSLCCGGEGAKPRRYGPSGSVSLFAEQRGGSLERSGARIEKFQGFREDREDGQQADSMDLFQLRSDVFPNSLGVRRRLLDDNENSALSEEKSAEDWKRSDKENNGFQQQESKIEQESSGGPKPKQQSEIAQVTEGQGNEWKGDEGKDQEVEEKKEWATNKARGDVSSTESHPKIEDGQQVNEWKNDNEETKKLELVQEIRQERKEVNNEEKKDWKNENEDKREEIQGGGEERKEEKEEEKREEIQGGGEERKEEQEEEKREDKPEVVEQKSEVQKEEVEEKAEEGAGARQNEQNRRDEEHQQQEAERKEGEEQQRQDPQREDRMETAGDEVKEVKDEGGEQRREELQLEVKETKEEKQAPKEQEEKQEEDKAEEKEDQQEEGTKNEWKEPKEETKNEWKEEQKEETKIEWKEEPKESVVERKEETKEQQQHNDEQQDEDRGHEQKELAEEKKYDRKEEETREENGAEEKREGWVQKEASTEERVDLSESVNNEDKHQGITTQEESKELAEEEQLGSEPKHDVQVEEWKSNPIQEANVEQGGGALDDGGIKAKTWEAEEKVPDNREQGGDTKDGESWGQNGENQEAQVRTDPKEQTRLDPIESVVNPQEGELINLPGDKNDGTDIEFSKLVTDPQDAGAEDENPAEFTAEGDDNPEELGDFTDELLGMGKKTEETVHTLNEILSPSVKKAADFSKRVMEKSHEQVVESFSPLVGREYAPLIASLISYGVLLLPLGLVVFLFERIRAALSLQKIILFMNVYLAAYFTTLLITTLAIKNEPMLLLFKYSPSSYIFLQVLQALGYAFYFVLQNIFLISMCTSEEFCRRFSALTQWVVASLIGLHYYILVFHRAMIKREPRITWKVYGVYSVCFFVLCFLSRAKRVKREYVYIGDDATDKKN